MVHSIGNAGEKMFGFVRSITKFGIRSKSVDPIYFESKELDFVTLVSIGPHLGLKFVISLSLTYLWLLDSFWPVFISARSFSQQRLEFT